MKIKIGGFIELSLIDVIGYPAAVIFFSGCNFKCPWCQNAPIANGEGTYIELSKLLDKLKRNILIDYVQVSGGEPTLQIKELTELFLETKKIGLKNSLNTNGYFTERIKYLLDLELLDHIAMDVKFPLKAGYEYEKVIGVKIKDVERRLEQTLELIRDFRFVELRTTVVPNLITKSDILKIAEFLSSISHNYIYVLQQFEPSDTIRDSKFKNLKRTDVKYLLDVAKEIKSKYKFKQVYIRAKELGVYKVK